MKRLAIFTSFFAAAALTVPAFAQSGTTDSSTKISGVASKDVAAGMDDPNSPFEKNNQTYRFVGARFRYIIIPQFYMGLFGSGGTTVGVPAFGPEFTIRKNGFEYVLSAMYASYAMDPTPFKAKTDGADAWEIVDTDVKTLYLMSDFLWSAEMSPKASFLYGAGFGIAAVFGDIHRVQAMPANGNVTSDPYTWVACPRPGAFSTCMNDNNHYGNYTEPSWANGGSKPFIFPWISLPQLSLRIKPVKQFETRLDLGFSITGFFFGMNAGYALPL